MRKCEIPPLAFAGLGPTFPGMLAGNAMELGILVEWLSCQPYPGMFQVSYAHSNVNPTLACYKYPMHTYRALEPAYRVLHFHYRALEPALVYNSSFSNYSLEVFFALCGSCSALEK